MNEKIAKLRNTAASLRMKATMGEVAVAAARDLAARIPRELTAKIDAAISDGTLATRWKDALEAAENGLGPFTGPSPNADEEKEIILAALSHMLADTVNAATKLAKDYGEEVEAQRQALFARAEGIEQAITELDEHDSEPQKESSTPPTP